MFLVSYGQKQILHFFFSIFTVLTYIKLMVLISVDMDRGDQNLYIGYKNSIRRPLL